MFTDEVEIILRAGNGGHGLVSFKPGKQAGPDGGHGGDGGNLIVRASTNMANLNHYMGKYEIAAEDGEKGGTSNCTGKGGEDKTVDLPVGSHLVDMENPNAEEIILSEDGQQVMVCIGGRGGRGNYELRSSRNTTPKFAEKGTKGQLRHFQIQIKLIASFGLVGLPNAGKSSLLNELTNANVKVAPYAFTTLEPNLGVVDGMVLADIPGLIEGAHEGRGLGIKFLKHIEKVKMLLHCIPADSDDVIWDYKAIMGELKSFDPEVAGKEQIILLTKSDLVEVGELEKKVKLLKKLQPQVIVVSVHDLDSLQSLKDLLKKIKQQTPIY